MSKLLIIYAHPSHDGCHGYLLDAVQKLLNANGRAYELIDLYAINYDPVLKNEELYSSNRRSVSGQNREFQKKITDTARLLFIYPTWWGNMPAIMKGFFDRIFVGDFGFTYKNHLPSGLLKNKKAVVFSATGAPHWYTSLFTHRQSVRVATKNILSFCGLKTRGFLLGSILHLTDKNKKRLDQAAAKIVKYLK
jgi:NAD(P)H dehydrogenase (quinone)